MKSSSSTVRQAWINRSRQWSNVEEPEGLQWNVPADDDVFSDGCFMEKIESWLHNCGSEANSKNRKCSLDSALQNYTCIDDLSLGTDALVLNDGKRPCDARLARCSSLKNQFHRLPSSTPRHRLCPPSLNLGHSMASSCPSSSTWKSMSSVSEVLQLYSEDAEETLYELGFGCEEPQVTVRIPPRFFTFPSQAQGINFRLFLDSQIRRIREEDPSLSLASRFRQVQVLTAMANAFYSLYSHVSRTPLQKLATPEFSFSSPLEKIERFRTSVRSEPRSPVERLKDTVNKMCLYTGSPRGSDSTSPQPSPKKRSSLPEVVDIVLKVKSGPAKRLDLGELNRISPTDLTLITCGHEKEQIQQSGVDVDILHAADETNQNMQDNQQTENGDISESISRKTDLNCAGNSVRASQASSLSALAVMDTEHSLSSCQPELDSCLTQSDPRTAEFNPVATVSYDLICPQIVESVHRASFCCQSTHSANSSLHISSTEKHIDRLCSASHKPCIQSIISEPKDESSSDDAPSQGDGSKSFPTLESTCSYGHYYITVTGLEGEDVSLCSVNTADPSHGSPVSSMKTCESLIETEKQYLNPVTHPGLGQFSGNRQQVNSFELEEVHSAGEEDFIQPEAAGKSTSQLSTTKLPYKGEVIRGDSMQSDSSGYADEEVSPSADRYSR